MPGRQATIWIVDDDPAIRASLDSLLRAKGYCVQTFKSAGDFLDSEIPDEPGCLLLDIRMPEMSGLDLQDELKQAGRRIPIIFMTGHGDVPDSVRALKAGAEEFLMKPLRHQTLLNAIEQALDHAIASRDERVRMMSLRKRYQAMTPRERQIMELVVSGLLNKQIAGELGITEATVKLHRAKAMQKMEAGSLAELVKMSQGLGRFEDE
jgi:FixJ family two-component response regulator